MGFKVLLSLLSAPLVVSADMSNLIIPSLVGLGLLTSTEAQPVPFDQNVWMGAYAFTDGHTMVHRIHRKDEEINPTAFAESVLFARDEARMREHMGWDARIGAQRANEANFPHQCKIASSSSPSPPCVFLYHQRGGEHGAMLPLPPATGADTLENARCYNLRDPNLYWSLGRDIKQFTVNKKPTGEVMFSSLRLQGRVAVEMYENESCWGSREIQIADWDAGSGRVTYRSSKTAQKKWRFSNWSPDTALDDHIVQDLHQPAYDMGEPACLCPDELGMYPPTNDKTYIAFMDKLIMEGYLYQNIPGTSTPMNGAQKTSILKVLMNPAIAEDIRVMLLELMLGPLYQNARKAGNYPAMSEIKRQAYDMIMVDGPTNLQFPFPYACGEQFTPGYVGFKSIKIVTAFREEEYSEMLCGKTMATESLQSILEFNDLSSITYIAQQAALAQFESEHPSYAYVAQSDLCMDHPDCAELWEYKPKNGHTCGSRFKDLGAQKLDLVGYTVKQLCRVSCTNCPNPVEWQKSRETDLLERWKQRLQLFNFVH